MKSIIELIFELAGGIVLLFATGWLFAHFTIYEEYYDKMLYDEDDTDLTNNNTKIDNDENINRINF